MRSVNFAAALLLCACAGDTGPQGAMGDPGSMGTMGTMGADGQSVTITVEPPGANCADGGVAMTSASGTAYVCNGADGNDGTNGSNGTNGTNGTNGVDATAPVGAVVAFAGPTAPAGWL